MVLIFAVLIAIVIVIVLILYIYRKAIVPKTAVDFKIKVEWKYNGQYEEIFSPIASDKYSERAELIDMVGISNSAYIRNIILKLNGNYEITYLLKTTKMLQNGR